MEHSYIGFYANKPGDWVKVTERFFYGKTYEAALKSLKLYYPSKHDYYLKLWS